MKLSNEELSSLLKEAADTLPQNADLTQVSTICDHLWQKKEQDHLNNLKEKLLSIVNQLPDMTGMDDTQRYQIITETIKSAT